MEKPNDVFVVRAEYGTLYHMQWHRMVFFRSTKAARSSSDKEIRALLAEDRPEESKSDSFAWRGSRRSENFGINFGINFRIRPGPNGGVEGQARGNGDDGKECGGELGPRAVVVLQGGVQKLGADGGYVGRKWG